MACEEALEDGRSAEAVVLRPRDWHPHPLRPQLIQDAERRARLSKEVLVHPSRYVHLSEGGGAKERALLGDVELVLRGLDATDHGGRQLAARERAQQLVGTRRLGVECQTCLEKACGGREGAWEEDELGGLGDTLEDLRRRAREDAHAIRLRVQQRRRGVRVLDRVTVGADHQE